MRFVVDLRQENRQYFPARDVRCTAFAPSFAHGSIQMQVLAKFEQVEV